MYIFFICSSLRIGLNHSRVEIPFVSLNRKFILTLLDRCHLVMSLKTEFSLNSMNGEENVLLLMSYGLHSTGNLGSW